jgi:hypothetical protein
MPLDNSGTQSFRTHRLKCKAIAGTPGPLSNAQTVPESTFVDYKLGRMPYLVQPSSGGPVTTDAGCCGGVSDCLPCGITPVAIRNVFPLSVGPQFPDQFGETVTVPPLPPSDYPLIACVGGGVGILVTVPPCPGASYTVTGLRLENNLTIECISYLIGTGDASSIGGENPSDFIIAYPMTNISCDDTTGQPLLSFTITITKNGCRTTVMTVDAR